MTEVAALFVRKDSAYKAIAGVDAWDVMRNAIHWSGTCPIVAHPPCSQWGVLRHMARCYLYMKDKCIGAYVGNMNDFAVVDCRVKAFIDGANWAKRNARKQSTSTENPLGRDP